ncbi:phosphatidylglycerol lysyltransferase domain-containing protein [Asticcacaulis sp. SL142]|uniref:phosphatidylglycerol lysyltransferase domain-containing protein n=1 Tax=Asticcacaulis sp. SL142 TaxID=2995155 RepID=UPI00226CE4BE|nr:phosphatidylglycerol lysyltransferase domain-containing protein [Asticcacaulis sp. SL142]WAC49276.1 phosphatidylglycerol lysyltransferase domain-containing protein [Asticcacaulis sp. SL142]
MATRLNVNQLLIDAATRLVPKLFGVMTFVIGVVLLLLVLTPIDPEALPVVQRLLPLELVEISHMAGTAIAVLLILVARGLWERVDTAWYMAIALLLLGAVVSLTRELAVAPAVVLVVCAALLVPCKQAFRRKSQLLTLKVRPLWMGVIGVTLLLIGLGGFYAYEQVPYAHRLWGQFEYEASASRFLRGLVIMVVTVGVFALYRLFGVARAAPPMPDEDDLSDLHEVVSESVNPQAWLALLRDKHILWSDDRKAFVMYGISGKQWVVMGEPVGDEAHRTQLCWQLKDMASLAKAKLSFYQITPAMLPLIIDLGLTPYKIGEEAMVDVNAFTTAGKKGINLRQTLKKYDGTATFEVIPPEQIEPELPRLREVSDIWLKSKGAKEKKYSLGFFDETYIRLMPVAVVRMDGKIMAFANLWPTGDRSELSLDLMRYDTDAPHGIMEYLFLQLIFYSRDAGYRYFSLGLAPLAGLEAGPLSPLWSKLGSLIYTFGGEIYNFEGLRAYKEKFRPQWQPRYFAIAGRETALVPALIALAALGVKSDKPQSAKALVKKA